MAKSATDIIQDVINAAVVDAIVALKGASQGLPNALLRDINSIHANTAFGDLPPAVQKAVSASVRDAFAQLRKEGYVVAEARSVAPARPPAFERSGDRPGSGPRPAPNRGSDRPDRAPRRGPGGPGKPGGPRRPPSGGGGGGGKR